VTRTIAPQQSSLPLAAAHFHIAQYSVSRFMLMLDFSLFELQTVKRPFNRFYYTKATPQKDVTQRAGKFDTNCTYIS
jgi:hypothetical protein